MQAKIDAILARVREPETGRSVADLNLVKRVRYSAGTQQFELVMNIESPRSTCIVCGLVSATIQRSIQRDLAEAFEQEFPGCQAVFS